MLRTKAGEFGHFQMDTASCHQRSRCAGDEQEIRWLKGTREDVLYDLRKFVFQDVCCDRLEENLKQPENNSISLATVARLIIF